MVIIRFTKLVEKGRKQASYVIRTAIITLLRRLFFVICLIKFYYTGNKILFDLKIKIKREKLSNSFEVAVVLNNPQPRNSYSQILLQMTVNMM